MYNFSLTFMWIWTVLFLIKFLSQVKCPHTNSLPMDMWNTIVSIYNQIFINASLFDLWYKPMLVFALIAILFKYQWNIKVIRRR